MLSGMLSFLQEGRVHGCNEHFSLMMFGYTLEEMKTKVCVCVCVRVCVCARVRVCVPVCVPVWLWGLGDAGVGEFLCE